MKNNMKKKGFTLVELLVVIAIIAILATVSVVGYTVFIKKANLSNDQTTIEMINDNLTAVTVGKEIKTAGDALTYLREANIYGEKLQAYSKGHHYVFDLANKAFVLVDEKGTVVYPKNVKSPELWALYSNRESDKVAGVKRYVATESVWYKSDADKVFDTTGFVVDLNGFSWSVDLAVANAVTITNGYVVAGTDGVSAGDGATQLEALATIAPTETKVENKIITSANVINSLKSSTAEEVTFSNCVIGANSVLTISKDVKVNLVFENCVFTSSQTSWAVQANNDGDLIVKNCVFNGGRGININNLGAVVVEGNTFQVAEHCMQLAGGNWDSVTIKNNNFVSGQGIARVHANMLAQADHSDTCPAREDVGAATTTPMENFKAISFDISGNTFSANFNAQFYSDCSCVDTYTAHLNTKVK